MFHVVPLMECIFLNYARVCNHVEDFYARNKGNSLHANWVINPIMVDNFAAPFNCTPVDRASD